MSPRYCVITKIKSTYGCVAMPQGLFIKTGPEQFTSVDPSVILNLRTWVLVFTEGEILVVDEGGREIGGVGRKPSKWDVECVYYSASELADAIAKSREVTDYYGTPEREH